MTKIQDREVKNREKLREQKEKRERVKGKERERGRELEQRENQVEKKINKTWLTWKIGR